MHQRVLGVITLPASLSYFEWYTSDKKASHTHSRWHGVIIAC